MTNRASQTAEVLPLELQQPSFADALAGLASGVSIAACWEGDTPRGLLLTSLTGLSVDPQRLIFTVRKEASAYPALASAEHCSITILAENDRDEASAFGSSQGAPRRFLPGRWNLAEPLFPRFLGGLVSFDAHIEQRIDVGAHHIVIVAVNAFTARNGLPLVYFERDLHGLA